VGQLACHLLLLLDNLAANGLQLLQCLQLGGGEARQQGLLLLLLA
jgi:hypothetical protein